MHYNFTSDVDFGVRRKIVALLEVSERRGLDIFGSEAWVTKSHQVVNGLVVRSDTNAWLVKLDNKARLDLARLATANGFRLVSFDATSLALVHRKTFPWKFVIGAVAGLWGGYALWGNNPKKQ